MTSFSGASLIGLPEGLYLPLVDESTDQYLRKNMNLNSIDESSIVDYGVFVTALAVFGSTVQKDRVSFMPTQDDFNAMSSEGYVSAKTIQNTIGSTGELQRRLGFYPRYTQPTKPRIERRLKWLVEHVACEVPELQDGDRINFQELVHWASDRNLVPQIKRINQLYDGNTSSLRRYLGLLQVNNGDKYSKTDLLKMAARAAKDNADKPTSLEAINDKYRSGETSRFEVHVIASFGGSGNLWDKLGYYYGQKNLTNQELVYFGAKKFIEMQDESIFISSKIESLSSLGQMPSESVLRERFGGITQYRSEVLEELSRYDIVKKQMIEIGIDSEVIDLIGKTQYQGSVALEKLVSSNIRFLRKLSLNSADAKYLRKLMYSGYDLLHDETFEYQIIDSVNCIKELVGNGSVNIIKTLGLFANIDAGEMYYKYLQLAKSNLVQTQVAEV